MFMSPFPSAESVRVDLGKARIVLRGAERLHGNRAISSLSQENLDAFVRQCLAHPNVQVRLIQTSIEYASKNHLIWI